MNHSGQASSKISEFLQTLVDSGGFKFKFTIDAREDQSLSNSRASASANESLSSEDRPRPVDISVEFSGPDTPLLTARNGELLLAIEHIAAKIIGLQPEEHDRISFDAENFKMLRRQELRLAAEAAVEKVRRTGQPHAFNPMSSHERRQLHLALTGSGLTSASSGIGSHRFVVLYPEGQQPTEQTPTPTQDRTQSIRNAFRRR